MNTGNEHNLESQIENSGKSITVTYLGNSCILITSPEGTRIVSDPYGEHPDGISSLPNDLTADAVTVSHIHSDHNNIAAVNGDPLVLTEPGTCLIGDVRVEAYAGWEGSPQGPNESMRNVIFVFEANHIKIVQLGDSGIVTDAEVMRAIENADLVVVNIDGYVIANPEVMTFMKEIKARTVLVAHYTLEGRQVWNGAPTTEEFIEKFGQRESVLRTGSEIEVSSGMPEQIVIMAPLMSDRA